ncbi:MAG: transposase [Firmicutes bacterium]|nr:transposase [Bacillota bacterium]
MRTITNKNGRNHIGNFPSLKMNNIIPWESRLERDYIYILEFEDAVRYFSAQPFTIYAQINGKAHRYTPDFLVKKNTETLVVEVKNEKNVVQKDTKLQIAIGTAYCQANDMTFKLVTEAIREGSYLNNIKMLTRYSRQGVSLYHMHNVFTCISKNKTMSINELFALMNEKYPNENWLAIIYCMIYKKNLKVDLMVPLSGKSVITGGQFENG